MRHDQALSLPRPKDRYVGFTLTETAIVMAIIGLILGAIWTAVGMLSMSNKVRAGVAQVEQVINGYRTIYQGTIPDAEGVQNALGIQVKVFPKELFANNAPVSPWGNPVYVVTHLGVNEILFSYGIQRPGGSDALTTAQCINMAMALMNVPGVIYVNINATSTPPGFSDNSVFIPFTNNEIHNLCSAHPDVGNQLQVGFKAR